MVKRVSEALGGMKELGSVLLFYLLALSIIATAALLLCGLVFWNYWLVLLGLMTGRLYLFLCEVGDELLQQQ